MRSYPLTLLTSITLTVALAGCSGDDGSASDSQGSSSSTTEATTGTTEATTTSESASATGGTASSSSDSSTSTTTTSDGTVTSDSATTVDPTTSTTDPTTGTTADPTTTTTGDDTTSSSTTGAIESCEDFYPVFEAEIAEIRGCDAADQCGVEMQGTSCGCTRNWVARLDADLSDFDALVKLAQELECELPFFSTCDCPEAKGFTCTDGICNWNYV